MDNLSDYEKTAVMMDMLLVLAGSGIVEFTGEYSQTEGAVLDWIRQHMKASVNCELVLRELDRSVGGAE